MSRALGPTDRSRNVSPVTKTWGTKPHPEDLVDRSNAARFARSDVDDHHIGAITRGGRHRIGGISLYRANRVPEVLERFSKHAAGHRVVFQDQDAQRPH